MNCNLKEPSFLLATLFSLGVHGVLASVLLSFSSKIYSEREFVTEVVWEKPSTAHPNNFPRHHFPNQGYAETNDKNPGKFCTKKVNKEGSAKSSMLSIKKANYITNNIVDSCLLKDANKKKKNEEDIKCIVEDAQKNFQRKIYHPLPQYPWLCRKRRQEGVVTLKVKINTEGQVIDVSLNKSSGYTPLDQAALEAMKSWIFAEESIEKTISIAFRLEG